MDDSEKMPLMVIGHSLRTRAFSKKLGNDLGIDYHKNQNTWMMRELLFDWLKRLNMYIGETVCRKILLLTDMCSAHGIRENRPILSDIRVELVPPKTNSKIQPLDAEIMACIKAKYRCRLLSRGFETSEAQKSPFKIFMFLLRFGARATSWKVALYR